MHVPQRYLSSAVLRASAIIAEKTKSEIFGLANAPAAILEGFAVFAFIFAMDINNGAFHTPSLRTYARVQQTLQRVKPGCSDNPDNYHSLSLARMPAVQVFPHLLLKL